MSSPQIEYVYNTSSTDSADTTSFGYGANGTAGVIGVTALTAPRNKRIRFQNPIQPTDRIQVEIKNNTGSWLPVSATDSASKISSLLIQNSVQYGIGITSTFINATDLDITFGTYSYPSGATYGAVGNGWATGLTGYLWRVAKYSSVGLAEIAPATEVSSGTISREGSWKSYTPTANGFTTLDINQGRYKVFGGFLHVSIVCTVTSATSTPATFDIPSGFSIDYSFDAAGSSIIVGTYACINSLGGCGNVCTYNTGIPNRIGLSGHYTQTIESLIGAVPANSVFTLLNTIYSISFKVPIL